MPVSQEKALDWRTRGMNVEEQKDGAWNVLQEQVSEGSWRAPGLTGCQSDSRTPGWLLLWGCALHGVFPKHL